MNSKNVKRKSPIKPSIDPMALVVEAQINRPKIKGLTDWFAGTQKPQHIGWYERYFTGSTINDPASSFHYWNGKYWLRTPGELSETHWRQLGDYPAWRGLAQQFIAGSEVFLIRGGRGRKKGIGCERKVRAILNYIDANHMISCTLLEDDPLASMPPFKSGETGLWNGLSFIVQ